MFRISYVLFKFLSNLSSAAIRKLFQEWNKVKVPVKMLDRMWGEADRTHYRNTLRNMPQVRNRGLYLHEKLQVNG